MDIHAAPVIQLFEQHGLISAALSLPSDIADLDASFCKLLVISCASYLESLMIGHMKQAFVSLGPQYGEFVRQFAIERKYHTWFDWAKPRPDFLFKRFGPDCYKLYIERVDRDPILENAGQSFMKLGTERNRLVHENLAEQSSEFTIIEVRQDFDYAVQFPGLAMQVVQDCFPVHSARA